MGQLGKPNVAYEVSGRRHAVYVRCAKSPIGGYDVRRRDNDRLLGRVFLSERSWHFSVGRGAFRGEGIDDTGHARDLVPPSLFGPVERPYRIYSRQQAVWELVAFLVHHRAPAVGFPAHRDVVAYREEGR